MVPVIKSYNKEIFLSMKEIREIISNIKNARDNLIFRVLYETGCLPNELVNIKIKDILGNKIRLNNRFVLISGKLAKDLSLFIEGNKLAKEDFLFFSRQGKNISEKRVNQIIRYYTKDYDSNFNPIKLRYYHVLHAYLNGVFIENIAKNLDLSEFRVFQILQNFKFSANKFQIGNYHNFLKRVGL
ncbi:MAG: site-specific integrase [Candidatus Woesearchaeota archaeon]